jgi:GrpB-like predicted nucleotidyltransferase (UPF0157 family)
MRDAELDFHAVGLGLEIGVVRLVRTDEAWADTGRRLAAEVHDAVGHAAVAVEHIGSTAVPGLLAKPIVDLAIGVRCDTAVVEVAAPLSHLGWIFRGDAGEAGGWVFVLEDRPERRVAHAHGVEFGGAQWSRYAEFRDLLRRSAAARRTYERVKQRLASLHPEDRRAYTAGKDDVVHGLFGTRP